MLLDNELITIKSPHSVKLTTDRIENQLKTKGFSIFLRLNQRSEAEKVGMQMPDTEVVIFGNPKVGTQLMQQYPSIALELPLKLVVQESDNGGSLVHLNSPEYLAKRHGIDQTIFVGLDELLRQSVLN